MKRTYFLLFLAFLFVSTYPIHSEEKHFVASTGSWNDDDNWDPWGVPFEDDEVIIDSDCSCDLDESVDVLSITIYGELNVELLGKLNVTTDLTIKNGGTLSVGDVAVLDVFTLESGGTLDFDSGTIYVGDGDSDDQMNLGESCTLGGEINVDGDLNVDDYAAFNGGLTVTGTLTSEYDSFYGYEGNAIINCNNNINQFVIDNEATIKSTLNAIRVTVDGTLKAQAGINCSYLNVTGYFYAQSDVLFEVEKKIDLTDANDFQMTKGTFKVNTKSVNASIIPEDDCYFNKLIISGSKTTELSQYDTDDIDTLWVKGNFTIDSNATFDANKWPLKLEGNLIVNGQYTFGTNEKPLVYFKKGGKHSISGNVGLCDLKIASGDTVETGNYVPSVAPSTLIEEGYLKGKIKSTQAISSNSLYSPGNLGLKLQNAANLKSVTVTRHTDSVYSSASHSIVRWFSISADSSADSATLRFYYTDGELNGNNESLLILWKNVSGNWTKYDSVTRNTSENYVEAIVDIPSGNSDWILSDSNNEDALPVELVSFTADVRQNSVILNWQTATEMNNYGFEIERSKEKSHWGKIGFVEGNGTSNSPNEYSFTDVVSQSGKYFYRLKQIDIDGAYKYSNVVEVIVGSPEKFELRQNYPNPFNPVTTIEYSIPIVKAKNFSPQQKVELKIYDVLGREIATLVNKKQLPGNYSVKFDASNLPSGVYIYSLRSGSFVATRKMILLK